ncbi:molybdopterin converting factor small subunit [Paraburkholderia tropica]|uniref:hypothetical protein n=1 Tax=Paraburkholderia tropica TaxID=92647 RepID=UPI00161D3848|nr:hypothetical protein [Paraburkholderia tropica]MBB3004426.1 molybdopterin converting factor small subunit [Paraburkholderia tropica]
MSETKELTVPERAAVALGTAEHEKNLIALSTKYADLVEIKNTAGRDQVHSAYMELKNTRVAIKSAGEAAREDANAFQKAVIAEVARLTAITATEEARLQKLRDDYDAEREREKQAKAEAERVRVNAIRVRIDEMRTIPSAMVGKTAEHIARCIEGVEKSPVTLEEFQEFAGECEMAKVATLDKLREMLAAQQAHEQEQARIAQERAELERLRAEAAERERVAAEERAAQEARDRAERERIAAEQRAAQEKAEASMRVEREAHEARMAAERAEIERQQAEIAAAKAEQDRIERERQEAIEAESRAKREADEAATRAEAQRIEAEQRAAVQEQMRREQEQFAANGPGDVELVKLLAHQYDVEIGDVMGWMKKFDYDAADEYFAAANVAANQMEKAA